MPESFMKLPAKHWCIKGNTNASVRKLSSCTDHSSPTRLVLLPFTVLSRWKLLLVTADAVQVLLAGTYKNS